MSDEERLSDLELRIIRQDDLLDTLNFQVYQQAKKLPNSKRPVRLWPDVCVKP